MPTTVHCDHLIQAKVGAIADLQVAEDTNAEVYDFLRTVWPSTASASGGRAAASTRSSSRTTRSPGGMMIGTDSHTPNAGGLGMVAIGVGGADAVDVMTGFLFNMRWPKLIGVHLTGSLHGGSTAIILKVAEVLTVKGGTGRSSSTSAPAPTRSRPPARPPSATWVPRSAPPPRCFYDENMAAYLRSTGRGAIADAANKVAEHLRPDPEVARRRPTTSTR